LRDARLHQAVLIGSRGSGAVFTKADLSDVYAPRAVLQKAIFSNAKLESANLVAANLRRANLSNTNLAHANLQETNLQEASCPGADFTAAQMDGADLRLADLRDAKLAEAIGLTQGQLDTACLNEGTTVPPGLSRPPPCSAHNERRRD
jgi:uncharacterized protein YjbI with pentapeptide repeats